MLIRLKNDDFFIEIDPSIIKFDDVIKMLEKYSFESKLILTLINTDHFIRHNTVFTFESIKDLKEFKDLKNL